MNYRDKLRNRLGIVESEDFLTSDDIDEIQDLEPDMPVEEDGYSLDSISSRLSKRFSEEIMGLADLSETEDEYEGMEEPIEGEPEEDIEDVDDDSLEGNVGDTNISITPEENKHSAFEKIAENMLDQILVPIRREANQLEESDVQNGLIMRRFYEYVYTNKDKIISYMTKGVK